VSAQDTVSVVVPTRDRPEALRRCLGALAAQTAPALEVVVVDDGSRDRDGVDRALTALPGARVVRSPGTGPAAARNLGVHAATGQTVCLLDDDCEPEPDWARALAAAARGAPGGAAAGRTVAPAGARAEVRASQAITNHLLTSSLRPDRSLGFAPTCNMAAARELLARMPFDSSYPAAAGEDRDWWDRALAAGVVAAHEPKAVVVHRQQLDPRGFWRQQVRYGRGAARFRSTATGRRLARPSFYAGLLRAGFAEGALAGLLVVVAQVATLSGVLAERGARRWDSWSRRRT
jgi:glycosyltransferase involved in cell wall biosynthesis